LAGRARFGYHEINDMKQQGFLFALKVLSCEGKYDESRPLENFLYTHLRNQFINYKRDTYIRNEPPCYNCIFFDPKYKKSKNQCGAFENKEECKKLSDWKSRNDRRRRLMNPVNIDECSPAYSENEDIGELEEMIDKELPPDLRSDYIRMRQKQSIPKTRRKKVQDAILLIKKRYDGEDQED
jgi:DNA-directed RNA polymerase specialized sigma24 family protein